MHQELLTVIWKKNSPYSKGTIAGCKFSLKTKSLYILFIDKFLCLNCVSDI